MRPAPTDDPEVWLPVAVPDRARYFEVSNHGRIRQIADWLGRMTPRLVPLFLDDDGYVVVSLSLSKHKRKKTWRSVSRLVLGAFHGPPFPGATASHLVPDKTNNRWDNLLWETMKDNIARMHRFPNPFGRTTRWLPEEHVREIRKRWKAGESHVKLAAEYKAHPKTVLDIARGTARRKVV